MPLSRTALALSLIHLFFCSFLLVAGHWHRQTTAAPSSSWRQQIPSKRSKRILIRGATAWTSASVGREGSAKHFPRLIKSSAQLQEGGKWQPGWQLAHPHCRRMGRWRFLSRVGTQILLDTRSRKICNSELGENKQVLCFFLIPLREFQLFVVHKIHRHKLERPGKT